MENDTIYNTVNKLEKYLFWCINSNRNSLNIIFPSQALIVIYMDMNPFKAAKLSEEIHWSRNFIIAYYYNSVHSSYTVGYI